MKDLQRLKKSGDYYKKVIRTFGDNLEHIAAGHSLSQLLDGYFCSRRGKEILNEMQNQTIDSKLVGKLLKLVDHLKELHQKAPIQEKRFLLSLISKIFTTEELRKFGFQFSSKQFSNSRKIKGISFQAGPDQKKGRPAIENETIKILKSFCYQNTTPAANRTINNPDSDGEPIPVRYVPCCLHCFYSLYCETATQNQLPDLSESSFRKYLPKEIKVAKKSTDLCPICEEGKKAEKRLNQGSYLFSENEWKILNEEKELYTTHKEYVKKQRGSFEEQIKKLKIGEAVILFDFKENIKLGGGPREVSKIFYEKSQRTILGTCLIFKQKNKKNEVETKFNYIDFVSEDLTHDAFFVKRCLEKLFSMPIFQNNRFKNLHLWCDGGKHFKNKDLIFFCLIQSRNCNSIELNFFIPYHGKSLCDSHFSVVSRIQKSYEKSVDSIESTQKFIEVMNNSFSRFAEEKKKKKEKHENKKTQKKQKETKKNKKKKEQKIVKDDSPTVLFVHIEPQQRPESRVAVEMKDVELYYHYFFLNDQIRAKVLESDLKYEKIKFEIIDKPLDKNTKVPPIRQKKTGPSKRILSQTNKRLTIQKKPPLQAPSYPYEEEVIISGSLPPPISHSTPSVFSTSSQFSDQDLLIPTFPPSLPTSLTFNQKRKRDSDNETEEENKRRKPNGGEEESDQFTSHSGMEWDQY